MKRWNVIVELPARHDIAEAHSWLAERDPDAADRGREIGIQFGLVEDDDVVSVCARSRRVDFGADDRDGFGR